jgi:hypothetical protein
MRKAAGPAEAEVKKVGFLLIFSSRLAFSGV